MSRLIDDRDNAHRNPRSEMFVLALSQRRWPNKCFGIQILPLRESMKNPWQNRTDSDVSFRTNIVSKSWINFAESTIRSALIGNRDDDWRAFRFSAALNLNTSFVFELNDWNECFAYNFRNHLKKLCQFDIKKSFFTVLIWRFILLSKLDYYY